jgi:hypothetical protein
MQREQACITSMTPHDAKLQNEPRGKSSGKIGTSTEEDFSTQPVWSASEKEVVL